MSDWQIAMWSALVGAGVGTIFSTLATLAIDWKRSRSRRDTLLAILATQLATFADPLLEFDSKAPWLRPSIDSVSLARILLDSDLLSTRADLKLINRLLGWVSAAGRYNTFATALTPIAVSGVQNPHVHAEWNVRAHESHYNAVVQRDLLMGCLVDRGVNVPKLLAGRNWNDPIPGRERFEI